MNRHIDESHRLENPVINPHIKGHLVFDKKRKKKPKINTKKGNIFSKWCCSNRIATYRRIKIDPYVIPCTKLQMDQGPKPSKSERGECGEYA